MSLIDDKMDSLISNLDDKQFYNVAFSLLVSLAPKYLFPP